MIFNSLRLFAVHANAYLREAVHAEPGRTQAVRAGHARKLLKALGMNYTAPSQDEIRKIGPCIYVANHTSILDALLIVAAFEGDLRILAKESLFRLPWLGTILKLEKHIRVARGRNASARNRAVRDDIRTAIAEGASVLFFPEGTRSSDGKLRKFRHGAFYNAIQTGVPVVPIVIRGAYEALPKKSLRLTPGDCSLTILPAIPLPDASLGDEAGRAEILADEAFRAMQDFQNAP